MSIRIKNIESEKLTIYVVDFSKESDSVENQISLLNELYGCFLNEKGNCGLILNVKGLKPNPKAKSHSKRLIDLLLVTENYLGAVILNADVFMQMIVKLVETKIVFDDGFKMAPRKTFFTKSMQQAENLLLDNLASREGENLD